MTIIDAMADRDNYGDVRVVNGERWLVAHVDGEGLCFTVYSRTHRQKHSRCLVETENEDEAVRYLVGLKG